MALLQRISKKEETTIAVDVVDRHGPLRPVLTAVRRSVTPLHRVIKSSSRALPALLRLRFRREKAAKGDFSGVGEMTTSFLINACLRVGDVAAASSALEKHVALGLKPTPVLAYRVVKAAARQARTV